MQHQGCRLLLSDGSSAFEGQLIGAPLSVSGELVFTTGMVGYSEAITDPSYYGQILVFTYPLIGNYGIPPKPPGEWPQPLPRGYESHRPHLSGVVIAVPSPTAYHWNSLYTLDQWLKKEQVPGIVGIDTRQLVHLIREGRNLLGRLEPHYPEGHRYLQPLVEDSPQTDLFDPSQYNILPYVTTSQPVVLGKGRKRVAVVDCGVKWNIIRQLIELGIEVEIVPWDSSLSDLDFDALVLSNGPGDPLKAESLIAQVRRYLARDRRPLLGICLGHQVLALAAGFQTTRMSYGHRSHNQPVYQVGTRRGYITSQNHGYVVTDTVMPQGWQIWFRNVNDETIEGIRHESLPFASVQFHPESAGGPRDTAWILEQFVAQLIKE